MSEHKNIHEALLAAQPNFEKPKKNATNEHFKNAYADLESVVDAVRGPLNGAGIVFYSLLETTETGEFEVTYLHHAASDTHLKTAIPLLLGKRDMQQLKSARTYARRIGLEDLTGIAPGDDEDAQVASQSTDMGTALKDAWKQGVLDSIPEGATPSEKAQAFAKAICEDFESVKGEKALSNRWNKHKKMVAEFEGRFPELHGQVVDAFENRMMEITGTDVPHNWGVAAQ